MDLKRPRRFTRRQFLQGCGGSALAGFGGVVYGRWGEPHWLEVDTVRVPIALDPEGKTPIRLLHLSDLHASPVVSYDYIAEAIELGLAQRPDLIAVTGDFFTNRVSSPSHYAEILARLPAAAPTFACLGNHDGGPWTAQVNGYRTTAEALALLRAARITCLQNDACALEVRGRIVQMIGVGDLWSGLCFPTMAFARAPDRGQAIRLLLNHNPDAKDLLRRFDWDVLICGHTHGGQIRLPLIGTPFAPVVDKRFIEGLHRWQNRWLYITRGVGNLHGVRFNCRPQVSVLELV